MEYIATAESGGELMECVSFFRGMGIVGCDEEEVWCDALASVGGLANIEALSEGTIYLSLVPVKDRKRCFDLLGFSPVASDFSSWAVENRLDAMASMFAWIPSEQSMYSEAGGLTLVESWMSGCSAARPELLAHETRRLGPEWISSIVVNARAPVVEETFELFDVLGMDQRRSLTDELNALVLSVGGVVTSREPCVSMYSRAGFFDDVAKFGLQALVNVQQLHLVTGTYSTEAVRNLGCYAPFRDVLACYAGAYCAGTAKGGILVATQDCAAFELEYDPSVDPADTLLQLVGYWTAVRSQVRRLPECCNGGCRVLTGVEVRSMVDYGDKTMGLEESYGLFQFVYDGLIVQHLPGCSFRRQGTMVADKTVIADAVSPAYDRHLHQVSRVCCLARCDCWMYGVRQLRTGEWLLMRQFVCTRILVRGFSWFGEQMLRLGGFPESHRDGKYVWYKYEDASMSKVLDYLDIGAIDREVLGASCGEGCVEARMLALSMWFDYVDKGEIRLTDVLWAVKFQHGVRMKFEGGLKQLYECACQDRHELKVDRGAVPGFIRDSIG